MKVRYLPPHAGWEIPRPQNRACSPPSSGVFFFCIRGKGSFPFHRNGDECCTFLLRSNSLCWLSNMNESREESGLNEPRKLEDLCATFTKRRRHQPADWPELLICPSSGIGGCCCPLCFCRIACLRELPRRIALCCIYPDVYVNRNSTIQLCEAQSQNALSQKALLVSGGMYVVD